MKEITEKSQAERNAVCEATDTAINNELRRLFSGYEPRLTSDTAFVNRVEQGMRKVEILKEHNRVSRRNSCIAMGIAAAVGFVCGVVLTLVYPFIRRWCGSIDFDTTRIGLPDMTLIVAVVILLAMVAAALVLMYNAYEFSMIRLTRQSGVKANDSTV